MDELIDPITDRTADLAAREQALSTLMRRVGTLRPYLTDQLEEELAGPDQRFANALLNALRVVYDREAVATFLGIAGREGLDLGLRGSALDALCSLYEETLRETAIAIDHDIILTPRDVHSAASELADGPAEFVVRGLSLYEEDLDAILRALTSISRDEQESESLRTETQQRLERLQSLSSIRGIMREEKGESLRLDGEFPVTIT